MKVICGQVQYSSFLRARAFSHFDSSSLADFAKKLLTRANEYVLQKFACSPTTEELAQYNFKGGLSEKRKEYFVYVAAVAKQYNTNIQASGSDMQIFDYVVLSLISQIKTLMFSKSVYLAGKNLPEPPPYTFSNAFSKVPSFHPILYLSKQHAHGLLSGKAQSDIQYRLFGALPTTSRYTLLDAALCAVQAIFD